MFEDLRKFVAPEFIFGAGARRLAGRYARNLGGRKLMIVTDPGVLAAGWAREVAESVEGVGLPYVFFSGVSSNPRAPEIMAGAELFRTEGCNALVAVGGGSPIDCAKGIGIVSTSRRHILEFEGVDQVTAPMPPLICVPTTGGTSADVSQFAIITASQERVKIAIISKAVVPDVSLIDPETLLTMDPYLSACTGLDALTHGIEAFVSNAHSPLTDVHALEGIRLLGENLIPSIREPGNLERRTGVMLGSLHAGLAFSNAILGATHAMAHSLGGYLDLAHGECNAILLDHVMEFNYPSAVERFERIGEAMGLELRGKSERERKKAIMDHIRKLKREAGMTASLRDRGLSPADVPPLSRKAMHDACLITNPRRAQVRDLELIYEESL